MDAFFGKEGRVVRPHGCFCNVFSYVEKGGSWKEDKVIKGKKAPGNRTNGGGVGIFHAIRSPHRGVEAVERARDSG